MHNIIREIKRLGVKGCLLTVFFIVAPLWAMTFWSGLSRNVYLASTMNVFWLAGTVGVIAAVLITLIAVVFFRHRLTRVQLAKLFCYSVFMIGVFSLQLPSALVRYLPHQRLQYLTEYDVSFPGPSHGKSGRCEMGLWLKDRHLNRWIQFCSSRAWIAANCERGMDRIEVVEEANQYGVRVVNYWCAWSPIKP
ncbi:MAG TPA: hypothetical protein DEF05_05035 [Erwinia sp.]|uniref:hypothetical protein n=1 Tax=Erwinia citreus TaxID=558 RepID=UPI000E83BF2B|nr:hypothetical protein [Erwinia sp.]HBV39053.1 hypothetical protein [Erwinia sp.]